MRLTERQYLSALKAKFNKAAVLREVTLNDEQAELVYRSYLAKHHPYYRRDYDKKGLAYDAPIPDNYDPRNVVLQRRIDFLIFESAQITAVEMKVSKADFKKDTEEKRRAWKERVNRFVYLTPKGLLSLDEIPVGCGLWEYEHGKITVTKKSTVNPTPEPFPPSFIKYLAWRVHLAEKK